LTKKPAPQATWFRRVLARFYHLRGATHRHWGNMNADRAEHELAVDDFTRAIELDPDYAEAYFGRGVLYWRELRNAYRAIRDMTRVIELSPTWAEALFNRAMAFQIRGDHEQAIADLEEYLIKGRNPFWRESAERQLALLRELVVERDAHRTSTSQETRLEQKSG
jgi:tetratricopeptide (TPR) repeat protein